MKKSNLWLFIFTAFICGFSAISTCQSQNFQIQIPDGNFDTDINTNNRSDIFFETNWNDWFWLLFLWWQDSIIDHSNSPITLTIWSDSIECKKQLRWYYSTNYWNFHTLPIDPTTTSAHGSFNNWWLFYDCYKGIETYTWVYWYIKRDIWDLWNTQEIRAWLNENKDWFKKESPLNLVLSAWWYNRALSGNALDSLANKSRFVARMPIHEFIQIWIPDEYFNNTAIFSENINEIYFNDAWNNWYWLFFLWTGINWNYEIKKDWWETLICDTKLNWYYTISFTDFGIFPLDQETLNITADYPGTEWVNIAEWWWLYYNCRKWATTYNWVYWHIKWTYWINWSNTHEIRAWIDSNGNWKINSPLELIYSENFRNTGRSLSGNFHSSLVKNSFVQNRFFGDMWLITWNNIPPVWTINDHHFYIYYSDYANKDIKIYIKSSTTWSTGIVTLTGFDVNWQFVTWFQTEVSLGNARPPYNFYWYKELIFPYEGTMRSGTISVIISNSWQNRTKSINFTIQPSKPKITITQNTECGKSITISATWSDNATLRYRINSNENSSCDDGSFNNSYTSPITFSNDNDNWKYICFEAINDWWRSHAWYQITWIDNKGPILLTDNIQIEECTTTQWNTTIIDSWCAGLPENNFYTLNGLSWTTSWNQSMLNITAQNNNVVWTQVWTITLTDNLSNQNTQTISLEITDVLPKFLNNINTQYYNWTISTTTEYWNVINALNVNEWSCWTWSITAELVWQCHYATWSTINNKILTITPDAGVQDTWTCVIQFTDNEWNSITWYVKFRIDTKAPTFISITWPTLQCSTWKTVKATIDETGTILYYTTGETCSTSWPYETWATNTKSFTKAFNDESDNGKYVCFKAIDNAQNTSYSWSQIISWIDRSAPTFELTWNYYWYYNYSNNSSYESTENQLYECNTWEIEIINAIDTWCAWLSWYYGRKLWNNWYNYVNDSRYYIYEQEATWLWLNIRIWDNFLNQNTAAITFVRQDKQITWDTEISVWYLIGEYIIDDVVSAFNITWRWTCETITIWTWLHSNATCEKINWTWLKITPDDNQNTGWFCDVYFSDWDTNITWRINFEIRTKTYYISLDSTGGTSTWQVKSHMEYTDFNVWKINIRLNNNNRIEGNTYNPKLWAHLYEISSIKWRNTQNKWLDTDNIDIETNVDIEAIDSELFDNMSKDKKCSLRNYEFELKEWFITDPAWNASERTNIITDNLYIFGDYLTLAGLSGFVKVTPKSNWSNNWMTLNILTRKQHQKGTGSVTCISSNSCPWFSCDNTWFIDDMHLIDTKNQEDSLVIIDGEPIMAPFFYSGTLQIDPLNTANLTPANREQRTGCKIRLKEDECEREIEFDIVLKSYPIKAWKYWEEDYWWDTLSQALIQWEWDNWFLFFITRPDEWSLWNIWYRITFTEDVADEFYYITWSAMVNWYYQNINVKRPTFNYYNPRSYMFIFPSE